jgi:hypothetical protein
MNDADALVAYLRGWISAHPGWHRASASDLAEQLAREADFTEIRIAGWLRTPQARFIQQAVMRVLPPTDRVAVGLLSEAVQIAAAQRTRGERLFAGGAVVVGVLIFAALQS